MNELIESDILIITKSRKDTLCLRNLLTKIYTPYTICVTNVSSESIMISNKVLNNLKDLYGIKAKLEGWSATAGFNVAENLVKKGWTDRNSMVYRNLKLVGRKTAVPS
jgi:hypothetical protein